MMNKLKINKKTFDRMVWNTTTDFTQKDYNEWLKNAMKSLKAIYDKLDSKDAPEAYLLGDIINILDNTKIELNEGEEERVDGCTILARAISLNQLISGFQANTITVQDDGGVTLKINDNTYDLVATAKQRVDRLSEK